MAFWTREEEKFGFGFDYGGAQRTSPVQVDDSGKHYLPSKKTAQAYGYSARPWRASEEEWEEMIDYRRGRSEENEVLLLYA